MNDKIKESIIKDIYKIINEIKKCHSKSRFELLCIELNSLYLLCEELDIYDCPNVDDYSYKTLDIDYRLYDNKFYQQITDNREYHIKFSKNYKKINYDKYDNSYNFYTKNKISLEDNFDFALEFLEKYDKKLFDTFKYLVDNNRIFISEGIMDDDESIYTPAETFCSYGGFKPYLILKRQGDITDSINLVHELMHCYDQMKNEYMSSKICIQKRNNCLEEVCSYYLQFVYIKYLMDKKIFNEDLEHSNIEYNYVCVDMMKKLNNEITKDIITEEIDEILNYSYGIAIAYHFLDRYLLDPEKTKKEMEDFIIFDGQYNMMEMLERANLKDELINSKVLKKYL